MDSHKYGEIGRSLLVPAKEIQKRLQRAGNWLNLYRKYVA